MQALSLDYTKPNKTLDRVIDSWDGYSSYLIIVDEASRYIWVFLTKSKEPPLDTIDTFLDRFGHRNGGSIRSDQGGELARSFAYSDLLLRKHKYVVEPTGADSPEDPQFPGGGQTTPKLPHALGNTTKSNTRVTRLS